MTQAVTAAVTAEAEVLGECVRCGGELAIAPVLHGVELGGAYLCDVCYFGTYHGSKAAALAALGPSGEAETEDDGPDGDGPTPAAPSARPVHPLLVVGSGPRTELTPEEEREWDEFLQAVEEDRARHPLEECQTCRRPSSPLIDGDCLACRGELLPPTGPWPDRAALAGVWVDVLGELAEAKAQLARIDARLAAIR